MSFREHRIGKQLGGVDNCPHCGVASPLLSQVWASGKPVPRTDNGAPSQWAVYACTTCGHLISAKGQRGEGASNPLIAEIFPDVWEVDSIVPERIRNYLTQAHKTLSAADASVVMSAASIDAMLKDHKLSKGSLYERIDKAVGEGILTQTMADWAHRVRLDANNPRHADDNTPHMTMQDAKRAFEYANALTEYLYLLPSRMPQQEPETQ